MELKQSFYKMSAGKLFFLAYFVCFAIFLAIGLRPAEAIDLEVSATLIIPAIGLESDVTTLSVKEHRLETPDYIAGSFSRFKNKTLLIGHSSTVFSKLKDLKVGNKIVYAGTKYQIVKIETMKKSEISMHDILADTDKRTIILMTCAGESLGGQDATHRLIITAEAE